jgi:hypothetical protein
MTTKRQQTMLKIAREREVKERRARKLEKKYAAAAQRRAEAKGEVSPPLPEAYEGRAGLPGFDAAQSDRA